MKRAIKGQPVAVTHCNKSALVLHELRNVYVIVNNKQHNAWALSLQIPARLPAHFQAFSILCRALLGQQ